MMGQLVSFARAPQPRTHRAPLTPLPLVLLRFHPIQGGGMGCAADGTMAAKNPISNLVDAVLDNRASGRGNMGMGMGGGSAQMAQMERGKLRLLL